eukprot:gene13116-14397_t
MNNFRTTIKHLRNHGRVRPPTIPLRLEGRFASSLVSQSRNAQSFNLQAILCAALLSLSLTTNSSECEKQYQNEEKIILSRNFVADVVENVAPAVVNIVVPGFTGASSGSGFIISKDGYIVTNAHVVAPSTDGNVVVTMMSGRKRPGKIHSIDVQSDLAIVQLNDVYDETLPTISLGVSSKVRSGEFVIAIGSPMHLQNSASLGIVSATARHASELGISNNRSEYIQTDAAINQGNSGGPLVNLDGEVIGINTMKVRGTDGISFAIPIDIASQIIKQLLTNKRVIRPYVGLKMANMIVTPEGTPAQSNSRRGRHHMQHALTAQETKVVVLDVVKGSPAYQCGIASGDVIIEVNGRPVSGVRDVLDAIGLEVGKTIEFKLQRQRGNEVVARLVTAPEDK